MLELGERYSEKRRANVYVWDCCEFDRREGVLGRVGIQDCVVEKSLDQGECCMPGPGPGLRAVESH